jgi:flagellin
MGMVVRTNMAALNANNSLAQASKAQQKGMQKLASGFKINCAADDASGLAITEKMKNQIKALDTAKDNCEDGANLIQTAEGSIGEIHDILTRMTELAEKAANGVLEDTDRGKLQKEMDQLSGEIDRIATTSNFNGQKLLDGSLGSNGYVKLEVSDRISYDSAGTANSMSADIDSAANQANTHGAAQYIKATFDTLGGVSGVQIDSAVATISGPNGDVMNSTASVLSGAADASTRGIKLQIGESSTQADKLEVQINSFHTDSLFAGIAGFVNSTADNTDKANDAIGAIKMNTENSTYNQAISIDISDQDHASAAADAIRQISNYVSDERGKLGAQQNRLEHTVNNLTTASENTTAAKSRILDTDMAKEMMAYTSKNVIAQAAQSMLAQANSQPQNVLSLLQ